MKLMYTDMFSTVCIFYIVQAFVTCLGAYNSSELDEYFRNYDLALECIHNKSLGLDVSETKIYFYDFVNNVNTSSRIDTAAIEILPFINDYCRRKFIFFVSGYKGYIDGEIEERVRQSFKHIPDVYLFIIDHSKYFFANEERRKRYIHFVSYTYYIGEALGKLLAHLTESGVPAEQIHAVGHSVGSHIISEAGVSYCRETSQRIGKITALDPAGPCFFRSAIEDQIRAGVAEYVEVYHCSAGQLGTSTALSDVDYFLNEEGKLQPGCEAYNLTDISECSHNACVKLWADTVQYHEMYVAVSCDTYQAYITGLCNENDRTTVGFFRTGHPTGKYYVSTVSHVENVYYT